MSITLKINRTTIVVSFPYNKKLVEDLKKSCPGARFDGKTKNWKIDIQLAPELADLMKRWGNEVPEDLKETTEKIKSLVDVDYFQKGIRIRASKAKNFPKEIPSGKQGAWVLVPAQYASKTLAWARRNKLSIDPALVEAIKGQFFREIQNHTHATSTSAHPVPITGLKSTPMPEQWVPVTALERDRKFLLADEQGLGKTLESLMMARREGREAKRLVIVCPDSLTQNWVEEMGTHFEEGTFTPAIVSSRTPKKPDAGVDSVIVGWSVLTAWEKTLKSWKPDMVIVDEGHYAKSGKATTRTEKVVTLTEDKQVKVEEVKKKTGGSYRSSAFVGLLKSLEPDDIALVLTGTPVPNRPQELLPLLQALQLEGYFGGSFEFQKRYCGGRKKFVGYGRGLNGFVWDFSGASNLIELNDRLLSSGNYIRRTKEHLVDSGRLPAKFVDGVNYYDLSTQPSPIFVAPDQKVMEEYKARKGEFVEEIIQGVTGGAEGLNLNTAKMRRKIASEGNRHKATLFELRRLAGLAAVPEVVKRVHRDYLDRGEKVIIVAHHLDVVEAYSQAFEGAVTIQGGLGVKKIEEAKALFNSAGFEHPVMVLGIEAGKTGHTLCKQPDKKCANVVFAEMPWNPGDSAQAQDRVWRLGQDREVHVVHMLVKGSVNEELYRMCRRKRLVVDALVDSREAGGGSSEDKAVIGELSMMIFDEERGSGGR